MQTLLDHPGVLLLVSFAFLTLATLLGVAMQARKGTLDEGRKGDFDIVLGATLTLLSLIAAFSFSMAASRYDHRKDLEESEANAIGTAYTRADLLPSADALRVRQLLREYIDLRIRFYSWADIVPRYDSVKDRELGDATTQTQGKLWAAVSAVARAAPTVNTSLVASAMNDAINSQGFAQAASWNRIPIGAWVLLYVLGAVAAGMIGRRFQIEPRQYRPVLIFPAIVAIALFLIADIDCPRGGVIRIVPENLLALRPLLN